MIGNQSNKRTRVALPLVALVAAAVFTWPAWGGAGRTAAQAEPTVQIAQAGDLGAILTGSNGLTLYVFDRDEANVSNCNDRCAETWPPLVLEEGDPAAPPDLSGVLTAFSRADGRRQVAYNERPLYYFANDTQPGDSRGDGVGGVWHVARPESAAAPSATAAPPSPAPAPSPSPPPPTPTPAPTPAPTPTPPYEPPSYPYP